MSACSVCWDEFHDDDTGGYNPSCRCGLMCRDCCRERCDQPAPMPDAPGDEMRTCNCFAVESDPTCNGHLPTCNMHWPSGHSGALPATDTPAETRDEMRALARRALMALDARKAEDIDEWARRLIASVLSVPVQGEP